MSSTIDISVTLRPDLPVWPSSSGWEIATQRWGESGDDISNSELTMDVHVGTHVEAPRHFLADGATLDELGLAPFIGPAHVAELRGIDLIDAAALEHADVPDRVERLLLRTDNSDWWPTSTTFDARYVGLDESAARWCASRDLRLVGIDYLSIQSQRASAETHRILMRHGIAIIEGLDLSKAQAGSWDLVCLPIALAGVEAAPARAVLRRTSP